MGSPTARCRDVSIVVPVYRGAQTLGPLVDEIVPFVEPSRTPAGRLFRVTEIILVWDCGPDGSDSAIRSIASTRPNVRAVWLTRNYGQHAATVAGLGSTSGEWVVTMDEDGQHDPASIGAMLDAAIERQSTLVYAQPTNAAPHRAWRNLGSRLAKGPFLRLFLDKDMVPFHSFRLIAGEHARLVSGLVGPGMYLDVALQWVVRRTTQCPVVLREEGRAAANYSLRKLFAHFWRLVLSVGNRPLRVIAGVGFVFAAAGALLAVAVTIMRLTGAIVVQGWASSVVIQLISGGFIMLALGVIAEYIGTMTSATLGRPTFVVGTDPAGLFED